MDSRYHPDYRKPALHPIQASDSIDTVFHHFRECNVFSTDSFTFLSILSLSARPLRRPPQTIRKFSKNRLGDDLHLMLCCNFSAWSCISLTKGLNYSSRRNLLIILEFNLLYTKSGSSVKKRT